MERMGEGSPYPQQHTLIPSFCSGDHIPGLRRGSQPKCCMSWGKLLNFSGP